MTKRVHDTNGWYEIKDNPISKVGVFPYLGSSLGIAGVNPNKVYWVLRPASSLKDLEFLESAKLIPWIDEHEMLGKSIDDDGNVQQEFTPAEEYGVEGVTGESVYFKDGTVYANIKVFSEDLKKNVDNGKVELSLGYTARYEKQSGIYKSQRYDFVQRELRGNHLATVDKGRMGSDVAVQDEMIILDRLCLLNNDGETMKTKKEVAEALAKLRGIGLDAAMEMIEGTGKDGYDMNNMTMDNICNMMDGKMSTMMDGMMEKMPGMMKSTMDEYMNEKDKGDKGAGMDGSDDALATANAKIAEQETELEGLRVVAKDQALKVEQEEKTALADKISESIGTFDHAAMSLADVAQYGLDKFKLKAPKGAEISVLDAHMNAVTASGGRFSVEDAALGKQTKPSAVAEFLSEDD